jgi:catechol 2,3-dioxygenase-like lactoylglutathione lyase family enzyme
MGKLHSERLSVVILRASDLDASVRFYRDGLGIPLEPGLNEPESDPWYGGRHQELSYREGANLHVSIFPARPPELPATRGVEIGFHVADANGLHEQMVKFGARVLHGPRTEPWGTTARYADPDGNIVAITST